MVLLRELSLGDKVLVTKTKAGYVKYLGRTKFAGGEWVGVELEKPVGAHDGIVQGYRYFKTERNHAIFVRPEDIDLYSDSHLAATHIQRIFRGHRSRKSMTMGLSPEATPELQEIAQHTNPTPTPSKEDHHYTATIRRASASESPMKHGRNGSFNPELTRDLENKLRERPADKELRDKNILKSPESDPDRPVMLMNLNKFLARRPSKVDMFKSGILVGNTVRGEKTNVEPKKRKLWVWGENTHGELSTGDDQDVRIPTEIRPPDKKNGIAQVSLGLHHTVCLTMGNDVYSCGSWIAGLLGHPDRANVPRLKKIEALERLKQANRDNRIVCVSCGDHHSVALMASGELYSWGGSLFGKLGRTGDTVSPYVIMSGLIGKRVTNVSCGNWHTAVCTDEGEVYTFGGGGKFYNRGQLGQADTEDCMVPRRIDSLAHVYIKDVCSGGYHTLALSDNREVYSWGRGEFGQLGLGLDANENEPKLIELISKAGRALALACGENHSLVAMESGELYSFGYGQQGQLGHGTGANERFPRKVKWLSSRNIAIVQVAAGWRHSIALSVDGDVYTWGHGDKGQLGHGNTKNHLLPCLVEGLRGCEIRHVAAGGSHSLAFNAYFKAAQEMVYIDIEYLQDEKPTSPTASKPLSPIQSNRRVRETTTTTTPAKNKNKTTTPNKSGTATPNKSGTVTPTTTRSTPASRHVSSYTSGIQTEDDDGNGDVEPEEVSIVDVSHIEGPRSIGQPRRRASYPQQQHTTTETTTTTEEMGHEYQDDDLDELPEQTHTTRVTERTRTPETTRARAQTPESQRKRPSTTTTTTTVVEEEEYFPRKNASHDDDDGHDTIPSNRRHSHDTHDQSTQQSRRRSMATQENMDDDEDEWIPKRAADTKIKRGDKMEEYARAVTPSKFFRSTHTSSTAFRIEIVYAANVAMTHRFITFQTRTPQSHFHSYLTKYTSQQYDHDPNTVFDHCIIAPGNTISRYAQNGYDTDKHTVEEKLHAQHIYEPDKGPVRATLMWVTRTIPHDENLWPEWAATAYQMLTQVCDDIGINSVTDETTTTHTLHTSSSSSSSSSLNASLLTSPQRPRFNSFTSTSGTTSIHKWMPSFREIRPLSSKPARGDVMTLGS